MVWRVGAVKVSFCINETMIPVYFENHFMVGMDELKL